MHAAPAFDHGEEFPFARSHRNAPVTGFASPDAAADRPLGEKAFDEVPGLAQRVAPNEAFGAGVIGCRGTRWTGGQFEETTGGRHPSIVPTAADNTNSTGFPVLFPLLSRTGLRKLGPFADSTVHWRQNAMKTPSSSMRTNERVPLRLAERSSAWAGEQGSPWPADLLEAFTLRMGSHGMCVSRALMACDRGYALRQLRDAHDLADDALRLMAVELFRHFESRQSGIPALH